MLLYVFFSTAGISGSTFLNASKSIFAIQFKKLFFIKLCIFTVGRSIVGNSLETHLKKVITYFSFHSNFRYYRKESLKESP